MSLSARRGYLLVEALCALALGALLAVAAASVVGATRRAIARLDARVSAERVAREALGVTAALVRASDSVVVLGDTALDLVLRIGSGVACARDSLELWLAPARVATGQPITVFTQAPEVGDEVAVLALDSLSAARAWVGETIDGTTERSPVAPCGLDDGWVSVGDSLARSRVLTLRTALTGVAGGDPVRVSRRGRLSTYVDGRGEWMLGWRRCLLGTCGVVQPIAGPLRTPGAGGFRVITVAPGPLVSISVHAVGAPVPATTLVSRADALR